MTKQQPRRRTSSATLLFCIIIGAAHSIEFNPTSPKLSCDSIGATLTPFTPTLIPNLSTLYAASTILLEPIRTSPTAATVGVGHGRMCILSSWTTDITTKSSTGEGYYVALGKSYDESDWERPPGKHSRFVEYTCGMATNSGTNFDIGDYLCEVTLPMTSKILPTGQLDELDAPYYLTYYERSLSVRNEISRFLQRTTFGPTSEELDALEVAYDSILSSTGGGNHVEAMERLQTEWVQNQQDPSTFSTGKFSSLREYYRKRLNPRTPEVYRIGESGPAPCEQHSRWRKFAFTAYDVVNSQYLRWGNNALGGFYQQQIPHKITVETVDLKVPTGVPTLGPSMVGVPTLSPVIDRTSRPVS
jgi:hypothetical protein